MILTDGATVPAGTATYIDANLAVGRYAVGGLAAAADPATTTTRVVGADRFETSTLVATTFFKAPTLLGFASAGAFADALCGGPGIAAKHGPMLLLPSSGPLPPSVSNYLASNRTTVESGTFYGGTFALGTDVFSEVQQGLG